MYFYIAAEIDAEGILTDQLRSKLESRPADKPKPKVLYTVAVGYCTIASLDFIAHSATVRL